MQKLLQQARLAGVSVMTAVRDLVQTDELPARSRTPLIAFLRDYDRWVKLAGEATADVLLEAVLMGATGWFAGFPNAYPAESVELFNLAKAGRLEEARKLYEKLVAVFRWDSRTEFVQAIKYVMDKIGRYGGPCRPPRGPLTEAHQRQLDADLARVV